MTDNEIIKALECCEEIDDVCEICPIYDMEGLSCINVLARKANKLIERQQAEIKRLKADRPKGKWKKYGYKWKCSVCNSKVNIDGTPLDGKLYYCSNCGAKMVGKTMNYCESCKYVDGCELAYEVNFCIDCEHFLYCRIRGVRCKGDHDIECNDGFEEVKNW